MLAEVDAQSGDKPAQIKVMVEALVFPLAKLTKNEPIGWSNYNHIMGQTALSNELSQNDCTDKVPKTAEKFIVSLAASSPKKP